MKLFLIPVYILASAGYAVAFVQDGEGEIQIGIKTALLVLAFAVVGMQMWSNYREVAALKREAEAVRKGSHKMRNNYMTVLLGFSMVVRIVMETSLDRAAKHRMEEVEKEVSKQMAELQEESRKAGLEPPWVRASD